MGDESEDEEEIDSDPEEEAFATKLAEQLLVQKTKGKKNKHTINDLDNEDPDDLDNWSYDTDDDDDDDSFPIFDDEQEEEEVDHDDDDDDDDDEVVSDIKKNNLNTKKGNKKKKH